MTITKEDVVKSLQAFALEANGDLTKRNYARLNYKPSHPTILALFGSWEAALNEIGENVVSLQTYTNEDMIKQIKISVEHNDGVASRSTYVNLNLKPSITTIEERFGSWSKAVEAAGFKANKPNTEPITDEEIIEALRKYYIENGNNIGYMEYEQSVKRPSASIVRKRFRTWNQALVKAGIPLNQNKSPIYTDKQLIEAMQEIARTLPCPLSKKMYSLYAEDHHPSVISIIRRYQTWSKALQVSGLPLIKKVYTRSEMLELIKGFYDFVGEEEASFDLYVKSGWLPGGTTIMRHFGSWENALHEIGYQLKFAHYNKDWAIKQVKQAVNEHNGSLTSTEYQNGGYKPSITWIKANFGSWKKMKKEIGF